jgi:flagellar hook-basal body complex protein FliE
MAIQPINSNPLSTIRELNPAQKSAASSSTKPVAETFENMLSSLNRSQQNADALIEKLAQGENVDLHTVMIGMEENNIKFNVALGIRDRLVEAYREIMRMQV